MHCILTISENNAVVLQEIALFNEVTSLEFLSDSLQRFLCIFAIVKLVIIAGLEVGGEDALRVKVFVASEDFQGDIEVLHLVVAQSNVHVNGFKLSSLKQQLLVNFSGLFVVTPQVVDGSQGELVFGAFLQLLMELHEGFLVILLVGQVEHQPDLQWSLVALLGLPPGIVVQAEGIVAASFENMKVLLVRTLAEELVVDMDGLAVLSHVEVAVGKPHAVLDLDVDAALVFQQGDGSHPVPRRKVVLQGGHLLLG